MRVLLANKFLYVHGGAERAVLALGAGLERRGHEVFWFGMQHPDNAVRGERVELVPRRDYHARGPGRFLDAAHMLYSPMARRRFARLLDRVRPDVVHVHNIYHQLTPSILDAARTRACPVVMTLHDYKLVCPRYDMVRDGAPCEICVDDGPMGCLRHRCGGDLLRSVLLTGEALLHRARGSYDAVQRFLAPSRFLLRMLQRGGWPQSRLRHVPNFAPPGVAPSPSAAAPDAERFVYAGRLSPEKGLRTLAAAVRGLERGTWVVCGRGPLHDELAALARTLPPGRIEMRGHLAAEELAFELRRARFMVLPSECYENAPLALLESMAHGRPVLASRIGGIPEFLDDGVHGTLVTPGDVTAWRQALEGALAEPQRLDGMGQAARQHVELHFDFEHHLNCVEQIYREVIG